MADDLILNMSYVAISISVHKLQRILSNFFMSLAGKTGSMKFVTLNGGIFFGQLDELTCCLFLTKKLHFFGSKC